VHSLERRRPAPGAPSKNSNPTFKVGVEISAGADPVTASDVSSNSSAAIKEEPTSLDQLHRFASNGYLFALLDATDQILVPHKAKLLGPTKAVSLFTGTANEWYWAVAPYLFQVDSELLDWIAEKLWKEPWGIFAMSKASLEDLRVHFKKFLMVKLPDGKQWLFRYYDPRILQAYLPTCEPWELQKFFGPVRAFATADDDEQKLMTLPGNAILPQARSADSGASVWWKIRPEQRLAFQRAAMENFTALVTKHVTEFFPDECKVLGAEGARANVAYCTERAAMYGIVDGQELCRYVDLAFAFGRDFDTDPECSWAGRILLNRELSAESKIAELLDVVAEIAEEEDD
jgi:hypothetical protein